MFNFSNFLMMHIGMTIYKPKSLDKKQSSLIFENYSYTNFEPQKGISFRTLLIITIQERNDETDSTKVNKTNEQ